MGGSGSTRRVVVEEVDGGGVVKISDSVVRRIRGQEGGAGDAPASPPLPKYRPPTVPDKDKAAAHQDVEAFYAHRFKELEERNSQLQKITNEQFVKAVQEVEQKFLKHTSMPVCQDMQSKVYECYLDNPKQTLNCAAQVRAFTTCVERARQNALLRKS